MRFSPFGTADQPEFLRIPKGEEDLVRRFPPGSHPLAQVLSCAQERNRSAARIVRAAYPGIPVVARDHEAGSGSQACDDVHDRA